MSGRLDGVLDDSPIARRLYVYTTPIDKAKVWLGARDGVGLIKVGETTKTDVRKRIWEQFTTASTAAEPFELLLDESAIIDGRGYRDTDIHKILKNRDVHHVKGEWFEGTIADVQSAILEIKTGQPQSQHRVATFTMRPEQQAAVDMTASYFAGNPKERNNAAPHFLWNAKMRFGKTFTTYKLAKRMGWTRILVLTYKPAVKAAWKEDLEGHVDFTGWQFKDSNTSWDSIDETKPLVWFASFQDMLGRGKNGEIKLHNEAAHLTDWDCVVLDEYHFGSWRESAKDLYDHTDKEDQAALASADDFSEESFPLNVDHYLYLSGTPFRALSEGEFGEDQIFSWTYTDEQRAKRNWPQSSGANPYRALPRLSMFTYSLSDVARRIAAEGEFNEFDLSAFFKAHKMADASGYEFNDPQGVQDWLNFVCGRNAQIKAMDLMEGRKTPLPYSDPRFLQSLRHTVWFMPDVASCFAMADMIRKDPFLSQYTPIVAAGDQAGMGAKALDPVNEQITKHPEQTRTITLSCGKLMTGVTVPPWTGIFMLKSTNSPESYFQAAFRVQSPWTRSTFNNPNVNEVIKDNCYVFDFDPNRALSLVTDYNLKLSEEGGQGIEERMGEFIRFLPIFCFEAGTMNELDPAAILDIASAGVGATMLAKRWRSPSLVNVGNSVLAKLLEDPELLASLEQIESFRVLSKDVTKRLSSEQDLEKAKKDKGSLTKEQEAEKKDNNSWRRELRDKLLKFAARIPVFMYLTDHREDALIEVIESLDTGLFEKATGLTLNDFKKLQAAGVFVSANMNPAIWHFKRFEATGIAYAGGKELAELVPGWDKVYDRSGTEMTPQHTGSQQ